MRRHEIDSGVMMLRGYTTQVQTALHDVLKQLLVLEKGAVREEVLAWMGELVTANAGRKKLQIDVLACGSHGAFVNFCGVMLRLCAPFLEPTGAKWVRAAQVACNESSSSLHLNFGPHPPTPDESMQSSQRIHPAANCPLFLSQAGKIDPSYVVSGRIDFSEETKLVATAGEARAELFTAPASGSPL